MLSVLQDNHMFFNEAHESFQGNNPEHHRSLCFHVLLLQESLADVKKQHQDCNDQQKLACHSRLLVPFLRVHTTDLKMHDTYLLYVTIHTD